MKIIANEYRHAAETAERLEGYARRIADLEAELAAMKHKWVTSEKWRKAYQDAKGKMFSMGGEVAEAAINTMPCNESQVDSWFRREYVHRDALDNANKELAAERARLDWLELHGATVELMEGGYWRVEWGGGATEGETARAAIDAAIKRAQ